MNNCEICNGTAYVLGELGDHLWFRCRCCGFEFYEQLPAIAEEES